MAKIIRKVWSIEPREFSRFHDGKVVNTFYFLRLTATFDNGRVAYCEVDICGGGDAPRDPVVFWTTMHFDALACEAGIENLIRGEW